MQNAEHYYNISLFPEGKEVHDINYCSFMRFPIQRTTPYCLIRCQFPQLMAGKYIEQISDDKYPLLKLKIHTLEQLSPGGDKRHRLILDQQMMCIAIKPITQLKYHQPMIECLLVLVHPILYYMDQTNSYNVYHNPGEGITSYSVLKDFEGWLKSNHGDMFDFKHIGANENMNMHKYEQILVKCSSDTNVPNSLIYTYKINNAPSFYFFDNFSIGDKVKNEIVCYYINLEALYKQFSKKSRKYADMRKFSKIINETPISDREKRFNKPGNRFIFNTFNIKYDHKKEPQSTMLPTMDSSIIENISFGSNKRKVSGGKSGQFKNKEYGNSSSFSRLYVPDTVENAMQRFQSSLSLMKDKIRALTQIEFANSYPDYPQFGQKYDLTDPGVYEYTPLGIANIFIRRDFKEADLRLINKVQMLRFNSEG